MHGGGAFDGRFFPCSWPAGASDKQTRCQVAGKVPLVVRVGLQGVEGLGVSFVWKNGGSKPTSVGVFF